MNAMKPTVLIAESDDNDFWFFDLAFQKSGNGAALVRMRDGMEALDYLAGKGAFSDRAKHPLPKLFILDLKMPRRNGFEVLEWLQKQRELVWIPTVVLSSSDDPRDVNRAGALGANSYVVKPKNHDHYIEIIRNLKEYWLELNRAPMPPESVPATTLSTPSSVCAPTAYQPVEKCAR